MSRSTPSSLEGSIAIYLLGTPAVWWAGDTLNISRRHVRGLLYYLAAQRTHSSRESLCLLFWPDIPEINARRNLTRALTHLRRALPMPSALITDEETVHLDEKYFWCDVLELKKLSQAEMNLENTEQAIDLYRGSFLEGFYLPGSLEFERWLSQECGALENIYLGALSRMVEAKAADEDYVRAISYAQRYLEKDELAEEMHRRLISLYAQSGDRSRALRQFEACVSILERELGARPLPETRAVYESVLENRLPILQAELTAAMLPSPSRFLGQEVPLVGRSATIRHLEDCLQQVKAGHIKVVLISGEPGIGKSRLLDDFAERCRAKNPVLLCAGQLAEGSVPFHPLVEALRSGLPYIPPSLPPIWCAEVTRILPELRSLFPDLPPPVSLKGDEARIRLFEALCRYIFSMQIDVDAVVLCCDDLHWFDRTSLSWLVYLCRQLATQKRHVLVIGTYRSEDAGCLQGLRDNLARLNLLEEVNLTGLDESSLLELVRHMAFNITTSETFASKLRKVTGGNPFFALETLRALAEEGRLADNLDDVADFPLPKGVQEAVSRRLGRLNPRSRQVLEAGAVLGDAFGFEAVRLTAGRSDLESVDGLDILVNRQLLVEEAENYHFSHDLVRRTTLAAASLLRLRLLHARAGKALEKLEPEAVTALAEHFETGGQWSKALHYHDLAYLRAEALFAWLEAESHLEHSLKILAHLDPDNTHAEHLRRRFQVFTRLTQLQHLQGLLEPRDASLQSMQALADHSLDPQLEMQTLLLKVQYLNSDASYQEALAVGESGLALADRLGDHSSHSRFLAQIGLSYHVLGRPVQALSALQEASAEIDECGDIALRTMVLGIMGQVYPTLGDYRHALDCVQEAYALHQELGDPYGAARYVDIGHLYGNLGRFQEARQFLEECLSTARKASVPGFEAHALLAMGGYHAYQGNPILAIESYQAALEILEGLRRENLAASAMAGTGFAYYLLGDLQIGRGWLERGLEIARSIGHRMRVAQVLFQLALLEISAGQLPAARDRVQEGLTIARDIRSVEQISLGLAVLARIERNSGMPDRAKGYAQEALHYAQQHDLLALEMLSRVEVALALVELNRIPSACEHTSRAVLLIPRAHQLWIGAEEVHGAHARTLKHMGRMQMAEEHECIAQAILQGKAGNIPNLALRATFLARYRQVA